MRALDGKYVHAHRGATWGTNHEKRGPILTAVDLLGPRGPCAWGGRPLCAIRQGSSLPWTRVPEPSESGYHALGTIGRRGWTSLLVVSTATLKMKASIMLLSLPRPNRYLNIRLLLLQGETSPLVNQIRCCDARTRPACWTITPFSKVVCAVLRIIHKHTHARANANANTCGGWPVLPRCTLPQRPQNSAAPSVQIKSWNV